MSLKQITVNGGSIPASAFELFEHVEKIVLNDGVDYLGTSVFSKCSALTELVIPDSVTRIGGSLGRRCPLLETMEEEAENGDGYLYIGKVLYKYLGEEDVDLVIKDGTVSICARLLLNNQKYIKTVKCPSSLRYIGSEREFDGTFSGCTNLTKVELNEGLEFIHQRSFAGCSSLSEINLPDSINYIGSKALLGTAWYDNLPDGDVYIGNVYYGYKGEMTEDTTVTIKDGTYCISGSAFSNGVGYSSTHAYDKLVAVNIPDSVEWIDDGAFAECIGLKSVNLPKNLTCLGKQAFYNCTSLEGTVVIPAGVWILSTGVFSGSGISELRFAEGSKLKYVAKNSVPTGCTTWLPNSVERISRYMMANSSDTAIIILPADNNLVLTPYWYYDELSTYGNIYCTATIADYYKYGSFVTYYSEEEPPRNENGGYAGIYTGSSESTCNYWHYDENGKPVLWGEEIEEIVQPKYEVLSSTLGTSDSEGAEKLFDGSINTKWCVSFDSENGAYVTFSLGQEVELNKYTFTTADNNASYAGRNPKSWTIYGSNDENCADSSYEGWTEICSVTDDETMQDINYTEYSFSADGNTTAYQYYKIVFTANGGNDILQLSEITLSYTLS